MGMLGNFIAGAAGDAADYTKRSGLQAQMQEAEMLKAQRIAEMQQNYKIADEDRGRANDLKAGQDIESTAKGMIAANAPPKPGVATDGTLTVDGAGLDQTQKASRLETLQAQADAAKSKGYTKQATEINAEIQSEVGNKRADSQDKRFDQQNEAGNKRADNLQEYNQRREDRLDRMAEAQQAFQQGRASKDDARATQADTNAQRIATVAAMKGTQEDIKSLEFDKKNIPLTMDMAAAKTYSDKIDGQLATLRNEASRYRKTLAGAGLDAGEAPSGDAKTPPPFNPAAFRDTPTAATPADAPKSAATAAPRASIPAPPQQVSTVSAPPDADLIDKAMQESREMGEGTRMQWSSPKMKAAYQYAKDQESAASNEALGKRQAEFNSRFSPRQGR